jgi:hypothetical protein
MHDPTTPSQLSDRELRNAIIAAEPHGFRREPDMHPRAYDADLREDGRDACAFLAERHPVLLREALGRPDPIGPEEAATRIMDSGRITCADTDPVIDAAERRGFVAPTTDLPLMPAMVRFDQAKAAVAYLWEFDQDALVDVLGDAALLAPTPDDAWFPCPSCGR